jgi:hypothetical protein
MKNIHVIPTDKPSRLGNVHGKLFFFKDGKWDNTENWRCKNIYITSNEEIKEGDFSFYPPFGVGVNIVIDGELCFHIESKNGKGSFTQRTYQTFDKNKRIILTTDQDLINDGVQAIDDEFLEWFVKNPSCEIVPIITTIVQDEAEYKTNIGFESWRKEEPKQETLEEAAEKYHNKISKKRNTQLGVPSEDFIAGAKWQAKRMYNDAEVLRIVTSCKEYLSFGDEFDEKEWFEQHKKK